MSDWMQAPSHWDIFCRFYSNGHLDCLKALEILSIYHEELSNSTTQTDKGDLSLFLNKELNY